ncbi:hypothetical protein WA026_008880 [Henosepilachna vigintioctopunctata]|uniref:Elongation factor 1 beta central acidic region eukaryote domain-containing protein n=1 Tax=Henosepilachna vigintioctopunctata TaxID=420089 RepID=A0AAW1V8Z6_9CUCU
MGGRNHRVNSQQPQDTVLVIGRDDNCNSRMSCGSSATCPMKTAPTTAAPPPKKEEDDDVDLFGSDNEEKSDEAAHIRDVRLKAYADKKSKKPELIAKSSIVVD